MRQNPLARFGFRHLVAQMEHLPTTDKRHHVTQVPPGSKKDQTKKGHRHR
jgi:hypothetical protein